MKTITLLALCLFALSPVARAAGPDDLIRLYEEEILAHDLYVALGKIHPDVMPLQNIPHSERRHRDAVAAILKSEGIQLPTPACGRRFISEGLDETFVKWLAEGRKSAGDACRVGVRLEEFDIADLRKAQADFPAHKEVLAQLEAASNNHLRAFHRNLISIDGDTYQPAALTSAEMNAILKSSQGACRCGDTCGGKQRPGAGSGKRGGGQGRGKRSGANTRPCSKSE